MEKLSYRSDLIDKRRWGAGPWVDEPDKIQWPDKATGLPCLMVRNPDMGHWCGYVGVPPGHQDHGRPPSDLTYLYDAHGGLNFASPCQTAETFKDLTVCHVPGPGEPDDVWWLGFDCEHVGRDVVPYMAGVEYKSVLVKAGLPATASSFLRDGKYRDVAYVTAEVTALAAQVKARELPKTGKVVTRETRSKRR